MPKKIIFFIGFAFLFLAHASVIHASNPTITNILGTNQGTYYQTNSGFAPNASFVGAYNIVSSGNNTFFLYDMTVPDHEGTHMPVLTYYNGTTLTKIANLDEDDAMRMKVYGNTIYIPGRDPNNGDGWDAGNLYTVDATTAAFTKLRYKFGSNHYVDATTTDANGNYLFSGLKPTAYILKIIKPANYILTTASVGINKDNTIDSNFTVATSTYTQCVDSAGSMGIQFTHPFTDDTIDAGIKFSNGAAAGTPTLGTKDNSFYTGGMNLGDFVWNDTNANGKQDPGELGMAGVRIELYTLDPYFPCVIHANGFTKDDAGNLYYDAGTSFGDEDIDTTFPGWHKKGTHLANTIFKSTDNGANWTAISELTDGYEVEDLTYTGGYFYKTFRYDDVPDIPAPYIANFYNIIKYSTDGYNWNGYNLYGDVTTPNVDWFGDLYNMTRRKITSDGGFVNFKNKVVVATSDNNTLAVMSQGDQITITNTNINTLGDIIPGYIDIGYDPVSDDNTGQGQRFNSAVAVGDNYYYTIGTDNKIYLSTDLRNFTPVADFSTVDSGAQLLTLAYSSSNDSLMAGTISSAGGLYKISNAALIANLTKITNPDSSMSFTDQFEGVNLKTIGSTGNTPVEIDKNSLVLTRVNTTNFNSSCGDWSAVTGDTSLSDQKSFVSGLGSVSCVSTTHDLYIPISSPATALALVICPDATSLGSVTYSCSNGVEFFDGDTKTVNGVSVTVSKVTVGSQLYWLASGVNGTGGINVNDITPPTGSMVINNNNNYTWNYIQYLTINASDNIDPASSLQMQISEDINFTNASWQPYATSNTFIGSKGDGTKTIYIRFKDSQQNISQTYSDSIILDTTVSPAVINQMNTVQTPGSTPSLNPASYPSKPASYPAQNSNPPTQEIDNTIPTTSDSSNIFIIIVALILGLIAFILFFKRKKSKSKDEIQRSSFL